MRKWQAKLLARLAQLVGKDYLVAPLSKTDYTLMKYTPISKLIKKWDKQFKRKDK